MAKTAIDAMKASGFEIGQFACITKLRVNSCNEGGKLEWVISPEFEMLDKFEMECLNEAIEMFNSQTDDQRKIKRIKG